MLSKGIKTTIVSTKKTIYLIRHGQTDYNKQGIIQGSGVNSQLNDIGHLQAQQFYQAYNHIPFKAIYSSELIRAVQTVSPFRERGYNIKTMSGLNEISWGILEGKTNNHENQQLFNEMVSDWRAGLIDRCVADGESPRSMFRRQSIALSSIMKQTTEDLILICMHGRAMRSFLCLLTGSPLSQMDDYKHSNLCLYVLKENGQYFDIEIENSVEHLY